MSLPATKTQVTEHPGTLGVTAAMSGQEMEADVQRKLKLWGVIEAFRDGRMPDNKQIDQALNYAIENSPVDLSKLSPDGKILIEDTRDLLETLRMIVYEKNADELFQNSVWHSAHGDVSRGKQDEVIPVSKNAVKSDADQAAAHLRVLATLFITNSEARKLFSDLGIIGRDIFATGAAKVAEKARPDQSQLDQVDKEAPSGEWIGADGQKHGKNETPELQLKGPGGSQIRYNPKDAPGNAKTIDQDGNERTASEAKEEAKSAAQEKKQQAQDAKESAKSQAKDHANDMNNNRDPNASFSEQKDQLASRAQDKAPDVDGDDAKGQAKGKLNDLKSKIPDEHKEKVKGAANDTKDFLKEQFPEERREQFIYRLKKVVVECQEHKDYQEAMSWLLDTFSNYKGHAKTVAHKGQESAGAVAEDPAVSKATLGFRTLLERFANGKSLDGVIDALDAIYSDAQNDPELRKWFTKFSDYTHQILLEPGYILEDSADKEGRELVDSGKYFFQDKYKGHQENLFDQIQLFFTAMNDDPLNLRLSEDVKRLTKDILFDQEGNLTFKPKLWNDIREVILPMVIKNVGYVPIPRAEYSDDKIDLVIENLVLSGPNLFPNVVLLEAFTAFKFSPYPAINKTLDSSHQKLRMGLSQIQADIRDVNFAFRRKSGWPKFHDHGLADVVISGKGISVDVELETVENRRDSVFKVNFVNVTIDNLRFAIRDSKHDILYKFIKVTANNIIKKAVSTAVQVALKKALQEVDNQLTEVRNNMEEAKRSDDTNRRERLKELYARKKQTAQENAKKADEKTGTFKIVTSRESQLNPDLAHDPKNSIAKRMFKVEDLAFSGKEWRSPAFSLTDSKHPAVTGETHPHAVKGAGAGKSLTSKLE
ncbi:hypothetical protein P7C73_g600, partial [Tremellales sp. Uapishka_1]